MVDLDALLTLQAHDTELDQLRHRIDHHEMRGVIAGCSEELAAVDARVAEPEGRRAALRRELKRLEDDAAGYTDRIAREDARLYDGSVTSPKELQAITREIESLRAHLGGLEDSELELMEQLEALDIELGAADAERAAILARRSEAEDALTVAVAELEARIETVAAQRSEAVAGVPAELLATYSALRSRLGGVAVARLSGNRCEGCHLALPAGELDEVRRVPADAVAYCPECGRMLVR